MNKHRYYTVGRPPMPGAIPGDGLVDTKSFMDRHLVPEIGCRAWGYAEYDRCLTAQEVADYEMVEGDIVA